MENIISKRSKLLPDTAAPTAGSGSVLISLYDTTPDEEITLEEFEKFALDRLLVLREIESAKNRGVKDDELSERLKHVLGKYLPSQRGSNSEERARQQRKDILSHFILRLAYCSSEENRRWFLHNECALFRYRFDQLPPDQRSTFLKDNGLHFEQVDAVEYGELREKLNCVLIKGIKTEERSYYKVPFEEVLDLVTQRKVFLKGGIAYVPQSELVSIVLAHFRTALSRALTISSRARKIWEDDERLRPMLQVLRQPKSLHDFKSSNVSGQVSLDQIPMLAAKCFPPCMVNLYTKLRETHHLKHGGRLQLGLFLKGVGISMEDSLAFWRSEFSRTMPVDKFDKEYAYTIRHNYGKEGKRTDYTPFSCMKVIMSTPGAADFHGCPFRHFEEQPLKNILRTVGVPTDANREILELVKAQHYQVACTKCFEKSHPGVMLETTIAHPNNYFNEAFKALKLAQPDEVKTEVKTEPSTTATMKTDVKMEEAQ